MNRNIETVYDIESEGNGKKSLYNSRAGCGYPCIKSVSQNTLHFHYGVHFIVNPLHPSSSLPPFHLLRFPPSAPAIPAVSSVDPLPARAVCTLPLIVNKHIQPILHEIPRHHRIRRAHARPLGEVFFLENLFPVSAISLSLFLPLLSPPLSSNLRFDSQRALSHLRIQDRGRRRWPGAPGPPAAA